MMKGKSQQKPGVQYSGNMIRNRKKEMKTEHTVNLTVLFLQERQFYADLKGEYRLSEVLSCVGG